MISTAPAIKGPFPVFEQRVGERDVWQGHVSSIADGVSILSGMALGWSKSKAGRKFEKSDAYTYSLYYSDGKFRGIIFLDPVPCGRGETHIADILVSRTAAK